MELTDESLSATCGLRMVPLSVRNSASIAFFGGALAGETRLGVIICLSQSKQNGWETWYSIANYGRQLAELKTRVRPVEAVGMDAALAEAEKAAAEAAAAFESCGSSTSNLKFKPFRFGLKVYTEQRLGFMRVLDGMAAKGGAAAAGDGAAKVLTLGAAAPQ